MEFMRTAEAGETDQQEQTGVPALIVQPKLRQKGRCLGASISPKRLYCWAGYRTLNVYFTIQIFGFGLSS